MNQQIPEILSLLIDRVWNEVKNQTEVVKAVDIGLHNKIVHTCMTSLQQGLYQ